jgi:hypothetical protein
MAYLRVGLDIKTNAALYPFSQIIQQLGLDKVEN